MPTEVEAKYVVPDRETFRALRRLESLAGYSVAPVAKVRVVDHYLDTRGRALTRQGWSCRLRAIGEGWTLTLKGPRSVQGAVMSREELEAPLADATTRPSRWPKGPLRQEVERLAGGAALRELLVIHQRRRLYHVCREGVPVVEMSLDVVRVGGEQLSARSAMVECELLPAGAAADLERLNEALVNDYGLIPEPRTKLQRALEFVETEIPPDDALLADRERTARPAVATPDELLARYGLDEGRARHVADTAEALFCGLAPIHGLDARALVLVRTAATLVDLGAPISVAHRHLVARDMILRQPLAGLTTDEGGIVAAALYLHRKRATPGRIDAAFPAPPAEEWRREALGVVALVRLAAALDTSRTQSTRIAEVALQDYIPRIVVTGPLAERDARRARRRSDLWAEVFWAAPEWEVRGADGAAPTPEAGPAQVAPQDLIALAALKILATHWGRMLAHREGAREGTDPEELHDMRVATRRMRSALGLLKSYLLAESLAPAVAGLRETAAALGEVRDLDVSLARARAYQTNLAPEEREGLAPLVDAMVSRRIAARQAMLAHLDGPAYEQFVAAFEALLAELRETAQQPGNEQDRVCSVAPRLLHIRWQVACAYGPVLEGAPIGLLHALRIECKHLRYALEFFRTALPGPVGEVIDQVVAMQDHLGDLHDADVAVAMLDRYLAQHDTADEGHAIAAYRDARVEERQRLLRTFPEAWERFMGPELEQAMAAIVAF